MRKSRNAKILRLICLAVWICISPSMAMGDEIKKQNLPDGVVRWYRPVAEKPYFFKVTEKVFDILIPNGDSLPFDRSVAFLVGVSDYEYISPDLPFVKNDLKALREYLLERGGFDEVYVATEGDVTAELVSGYMMDTFREKLGNRDRLLFYYSGHGADIGADTGYMQFSRARAGRFTPSHNLKIVDCRDWSRILPVKHALFIFDSCASGLAFTSKKGRFDNQGAIINTLSGNGSRTLITAGSADQESFGVGNNSVFTRAFLNALESDGDGLGFLTVTQVHGLLEGEVARFSQEYGKQMTPRRWEMDERKYNGTFLFINEKARNVEMPRQFQAKLRATPKGTGFGRVRIIAWVDGRLYLNDEYIRDVERGDGMPEWTMIPAGDHVAEVRAEGKVHRKPFSLAKGEQKEVIVEDTIVVIPVSPQPVTPKTSTLVVESRPGGAAIFINDKEYGTTPRSFKIEKAGVYMVRVEKEGYSPHAEPVRIELGKELEINPRLSQLVASVPETPKAGDLIDGPLPKMEFAWIPPGEFMMGSPDDEPGRNPDEGPQHRVTLSRGFYMQTTEVTQAQWEAVMGSNPSRFDDCGGDCPVEMVSWKDVQKYIQKLNRKEGGNKYRLPTEAEWEYAARAGTTTPFAFGSCLDTKYANYDGNYPLSGCPKGEYREKTIPVGSLGKSNAWGLYDMHGNVYEWCEDAWHDNYEGAPADGSVWVDKSQNAARVLRGGSWANFARFCRSAIRLRYVPDFRSHFIGFRLVRASAQY